MSTEDQQVTQDTAHAPAPTTVKNKANSYYYWHQHEKDRAKVGDVAPMPTPYLVSKDDARAVAAPAVPTVSVSKYSWCDGDKFVSVYIDTVVPEGGTLDESSIEATFTGNSFKVTFATADEAGRTRAKSLSIRLSKRIDKDRSSTKVKPKTQQILVRLAKKVESVWLDLEGEASDQDSAADGDAADAE
ncbi:heat shock protein Hsp20 [Leishmania donovani]|uniref:Heat_shock_protein_Hsp20_-_putative n=3 Tax=Leishmania donovani species complex TaxID=38574 RepID=A0A6L0XS03_LEIIN|nr:conserved hypothetical protein [Leishmania infantum JPCM5]XP_003863654.1 hypothetical protein, conserved [Leishmania donovani]CAC9526011.1 heat_shock_protein_Hsp20_-_putative [Leishmania infantum]AYU81785.1 heat shock protein Hsp20, putative [Leishmania donovani]TPP43750.1 CS domain family protein [Leishmania donovani]TPP47246.1 CS domain family protein [Leishmania donovani]CAJ1991771.1 heat shock protein Hsp20 [Leishmania donovani]|eukprot:XP_001467918.1 conserved hypothetical protein [Leishmania infantum JPCM5]